MSCSWRLCIRAGRWKPYARPRVWPCRSPRTSKSYIAGPAALATLGDLYARTRAAHSSPVRITLPVTVAAEGCHAFTSHPYTTAGAASAGIGSSGDRLVSTPSLMRDYPFVMAKGRGVEVWT